MVNERMAKPVTNPCFPNTFQSLFLFLLPSCETSLPGPCARGRHHGHHFRLLFPVFFYFIFFSYFPILFGRSGLYSAATRTGPLGGGLTGYSAD